MENNTQYFGQKEEEAVIDYINSNCKEEKNEIYNKYLLIPFQTMIESILRRYPIHTGNFDLIELERNAMTHLIEHMVLYDPNKITKFGNKTKAYSYCQTIVRNYFIDHSKKTVKSKRNNVYFDDCLDEINNNRSFFYEEENAENTNDIVDLINIISLKIESIVNDDKTLKPNEILVGNAITNILNNWELLFIEETHEGVFSKKITNKFTKNKVLFFIKELTGLSTKDIRVALKPFKEIYFFEKNEKYKE